MEEKKKVPAVAEEQKPKKPKGKPRGGNSPIIQDQQKELPMGKAAKYAAFIAEIVSWGEVDRSNIEELEERFQKYLAWCAANDMKVGNQMCYLALGIDRDTVYDWSHGRSRSIAHSDFIKKVQKVCAGYREALMQDGQINPVTGLFWQKNYDGLKDQQEVVLTPNNPLGNQTSPEELQQKYLESVVTDSAEEQKD